MPKIGGIFFLLGLVILFNGSSLIWRGRNMLQATVSDPTLAKRAKQYQDAGVVVVAAGLIIVLGSLLVIAQRGF